MEGFAQIALLALCCLVGTTVAYEDKDLKCGQREHLSGLVRVFNKDKKEISHRCSKFSPQLNSDVTCTLGNAMQCNGKEEGCNEPDSWIGGFQVFDSGSKAELYVPYCCKSDQVTLKQDKCKTVQITPGNGRQVKYFMPANRLLRMLTCQYVKASDGSSLKDMSFSSEECPYTVEKKK